MQSVLFKSIKHTCILYGVNILHIVTVSFRHISLCVLFTPFVPDPHSLSVEFITVKQPLFDGNERNRKC